MRSSPPAWPEFLLVWGSFTGLVVTYLGLETPLGIPLPGWWVRERFLIVLLFLSGIGLGLYRWGRAGHPPQRWKPSRPGARFQQILIYSKDNCPLCDEALEFLQDYAEFYRELHVVGIEQSPELFDAYAQSVPVVEIDGKIRFRGKIAPTLLRRLIEGTPLLDSQIDAH